MVTTCFVEPKGKWLTIRLTRHGTTSLAEPKAHGRLSGSHVSLTATIDFQLHGASRVGRSTAGGAHLPLFSACESVAVLLQAMRTGSQISVSQTGVSRYSVP